MNGGESQRALKVVRATFYATIFFYLMVCRDFSENGVGELVIHQNDFFLERKDFALGCFQIGFAHAMARADYSTHVLPPTIREQN